MNKILPYIRIFDAISEVRILSVSMFRFPSYIEKKQTITDTKSMSDVRSNFETEGR